MEPNSMEELSELTSLHLTKEALDAEVLMVAAEVASVEAEVDLEVVEEAVATAEEVATTVEDLAVVVAAVVIDEVDLAVALVAVTETVEKEDAVEAVGEETTTRISNISLFIMNPPYLSFK